MKADKRLLMTEDGIYYNQRKHGWISQNGSKKILHRHQLHLICSFLCGFLMAYTTLIFYDRYLVWSVQIEQHSTNTEYYQTGYMMALKEIEIEGNTLHDQLTRSVRVLCMVLTCPKYHYHRAIHIQRTWGKRCTKLVFMSSEDDEDLNAVTVVDRDDDIYTKLWNKTRESFRYVYENYMDEYDWFIKADDDTYVVMENLRYMLWAYPPDIPIYFGYEMKLGDVEYMSGGASYVLSREALKRFMEKSYHNETLCPTAESLDGEDVSMGVCLQNAGVLLGNSKYTSNEDEDPKMKFFPTTLEAYTEPQWNNTIPDWLFYMSLEPIETGLDCCSNFSIAFHYIEPAQLYSFEFLIYHMQAFSLRRTPGKLPNKFSREQVLKKFDKNTSLSIKKLN